MSEPITQGSTYRANLDGWRSDTLLMAIRPAGSSMWTFRVVQNGNLVDLNTGDVELFEEFIPPVSRQEKNAGRASRAGQVKVKKAVTHD